MFFFSTFAHFFLILFPFLFPCAGDVHRKAGRVIAFSDFCVSTPVHPFIIASQVDAFEVTNLLFASFAVDIPRLTLS